MLNSNNGIELMALPVSNVSMYDASTAAAEAITCAVRVKGRKPLRKVWCTYLVVPPHRLSVIENYTQGVGIELRADIFSGRVNLERHFSSRCLRGLCRTAECIGELDEGITSLKEIIGEHTALIVGVDAVS